MFTQVATWRHSGRLPKRFLWLHPRDRLARLNLPTHLYVAGTAADPIRRSGSFVFDIN